MRLEFPTWTLVLISLTNDLSVMATSFDKVPAHGLHVHMGLHDAPPLLLRLPACCAEFAAAAAAVLHPAATVSQPRHPLRSPALGCR